MAVILILQHFKTTQIPVYGKDSSASILRFKKWILVDQKSKKQIMLFKPNTNRLSKCHEHCEQRLCKVLQDGENCFALSISCFVVSPFYVAILHSLR